MGDKVMKASTAAILGFLAGMLVMAATAVNGSHLITWVSSF